MANGVAADAWSAVGGFMPASWRDHRSESSVDDPIRRHHYALAVPHPSLAVLAALLLAACLAAPASASASASGAASDSAKLRQARALWAKQHVRDYSFRLKLSCFCPPDVRRSVIVTVHNARPHGAPASSRHIDTFPEMFARIRETLTKPDSGGATVRYDTRRGFPRSASLDPIKLAVDDEYRWTADRFRVLRPR
jgi:hypothetical protein